MGKAAEMVKKLVELSNDGTPEYYGSDRFTELCTPDVDWVEMPSQFFPNGRSGDREKWREQVAQTQNFLRHRKIEINEIVEEGTIAAWTSTYHAAVGVDGLGWSRDTRFKIYMASITEVRNNMIIRHYDYLTAPEII